MKFFKRLRLRKLLEFPTTQEDVVYVPREKIMEEINIQKKRCSRHAIFMEVDIQNDDLRYLRSKGYRVSREMLLGMPCFEIYW